MQYFEFLGYKIVFDRQFLWVLYDITFPVPNNNNLLIQMVHDIFKNDNCIIRVHVHQLQYYTHVLQS